MHIEDPNQNQPDAPADDAAAAQVEQPDTPAAEPDPFTAGVEEARGQADPDEPAPPAQGPPAPDGQPKGDPPPSDPKPQDPPAGEPPVQDPRPDQPKSVDDEIKELGITNERTQTRFRELSERATENQRQRDAAQAKADEWEQTVASTRATPEQFGNALGYLSAINSGDPVQMGQAYDAMTKELAWLGQKLGREAPGFDPLSAHPDLSERVKSGDLSREMAAELAQHRARGTLQQERDTNQTQQWQAQQAQSAGMQQVQALGDQLRRQDPAFQQKFAYLLPTIEVIQSSMPPDQWAQAIHNAYQRLPAIAAPAPAPAPVRQPNPTRPAAAPALAPKITQDNAFEFGVSEARAAGR